MAKNPEGEEVVRLLSILRAVIRLLGLPLREVERRLGMGPSYLVRLFGGDLELKVEHVLAISRGLGLAPAEFFELAYPRRPDPPSETSKAIHKLLRDLRPTEPERQPSAGISEEDLPWKIQELVQQSLRDVLGGVV